MKTLLATAGACALLTVSSLDAAEMKPDAQSAAPGGALNGVDSTTRRGGTGWDCGLGRLR